jgi:hypothetical protein
MEPNLSSTGASPAPRALASTAIGLAVAAGMHWLLLLGRLSQAVARHARYEDGHITVRPAQLAVFLLSSLALAAAGFVSRQEIAGRSRRLTTFASWALIAGSVAWLLLVATRVLRFA